MAAAEKKRQKNVGPRAGQRIPVKVTAEEKERIERTARKVRLSVSALLRKLALGYEPPSMIDLETLSTLTRLRGDFGRLGGLLKLWLVDAPGQAVPESEVKAALDTILAKQGELSNLIIAIENATGD